MDIIAHQDAGSEHFLWRQSTSDGESLVQTHEFLYPRIDEKVVANADFASAVEIILIEHDVEESGVEHDITMIGEEYVVVILLQSLVKSEVMLLRGAPHQHLHHRLHHAELEVL